MPTAAPFGSWQSPLTTDVITEQTISIVEVIVDPANGEIYHVEERPHEGGRRVLVHSETSKDVFSASWNARTGVHEYGGSAAAVYRDVALFTDWATKRVYICSKQGGGWEVPKPVTPDYPNHRFGEFHIHPTLPHLVVCILEDHTKSAPTDVVNTLVLLDTNAQSYTTLAEGADFYAFGRFNPDGTKLAWIQWWHPDMPWEGSELYVASLSLTSDSLSISDTPKHIAGARTSEATTQPSWASLTKLVFLSDKSGFFNHYVYDCVSGTIRAALSEPLEQDLAEPVSRLGASDYAVLDEDTVLAPGNIDGQTGFLLIDLSKEQYSVCSSSYVTTSQVRAIPSGGGLGASVVFVGTEYDSPPALIRLALLFDKPHYNVLKETTNAMYLPALQGFEFSVAQSMTFQVQAESGQSAQPLHVVFYAPTNKSYSGGQEGEKPPCVVNVHGGPTSRAKLGLNWLTQYWTSRGWAWVDVNYRGSSGYGRAYRERLLGKWGIVDVDDCVTVVAELGKAELIDPKRVAIRGESAGGFTTLAALVKAPNVYATGTSYYGISDLQALEAETHKFESHYCKKLLGGSFNEMPEVYKDRSPLTHAKAISAPLLILHGDRDAVVPPNQAGLMHNKIESHGGKVKSKIFAGEGHGWGRAETIKEALELEIQWYGEVLGIAVQP